MKKPLTTGDIYELSGYLNGFIKFKDCHVVGCNGDLRLSKAWLQDFLQGDDVKAVLAWLQEQGGCCDCEVLLNVVSKVEGHPPPSFSLE